jgi:hypothetical protein
MIHKSRNVEMLRPRNPLLEGCLEESTGRMPPDVLNLSEVGNALLTERGAASPHGKSGRPAEPPQGVINAHSRGYVAQRCGKNRCCRNCRFPGVEPLSTREMGAPPSHRGRRSGARLAVLWHCTAACLDDGIAGVSLTRRSGGDG